MNKEPAVILGVIGAAVAAVLGVLVAFNLPLTQDQQDAIMAAIGPVGLLIIALITRQWVTPEARARSRERAALRQGRQEATPGTVRDVDLDPPAEA
ncbi:hypothetical protein [Microlunatus parietis]|uniref:Uncharacterized protein n=1 Tax=Microlunatus parietis TaxID=682979 RepID=A0A7Y9I2Q1_9ACTN|nr:hypothetical protein [Microlunatus parietis]NYE68854.1 hypothetical protein [Microlunatus parietis]